MSNYTYRSRGAPFFDTFLFGFLTMPTIAPLTNPYRGPVGGVGPRKVARAVTLIDA
jgi:hypothetical protein